MSSQSNRISRNVVPEQQDICRSVVPEHQDGSKLSPGASGRVEMTSRSCTISRNCSRIGRNVVPEHQDGSTRHVVPEEASGFLRPVKPDDRNSVNESKCRPAVMRSRLLSVSPFSNYVITHFIVETHNYQASYCNQFTNLVQTVIVTS